MDGTLIVSHRRNRSYLFQTVVSNHCGCTPKGVMGVKWPEILWEMQKYSLPGRPSNQNWVKSKNPLRNASKFLKKWQIVFDFTQFWLDGRPGNEYFWISYKISGLLTPLTPLDLYPQCLLKIKPETDWSSVRMFSKKTSVSWNDGMVLKNAKFWLLTSDFEIFQ